VIAEMEGRFRLAYVGPLNARGAKERRRLAGVVRRLGQRIRVDEWPEPDDDELRAAIYLARTIEPSEPVNAMRCHRAFSGAVCRLLTEENGYLDTALFPIELIQALVEYLSAHQWEWVGGRERFVFVASNPQFPGPDPLPIPEGLEEVAPGLYARVFRGDAQ
jgi:hypothetical protein